MRMLDRMGSDIDALKTAMFDLLSRARFVITECPDDLPPEYVELIGELSRAHDEMVEVLRGEDAK